MGKWEQVGLRLWRPPSPLDPIIRSERGRGRNRGRGGEGKRKRKRNDKERDSLALRSFGVENSIQSFQKVGSGLSCDLRPQSPLFPIII